MLRPARVMIAVLLGASALPAESPWIQMRSNNFQVYSQGTEQQTRTVLNYFERVRDFFVQMSGGEPPRALPVYIVMFASRKEYEPYRPKEFMIAHYSGRPDRDYIVLGEIGVEAEQTAAHEYVHLVVRHAGERFPPWLNEGLAEMYSTLQTVGDEVEFGSPIRARVQALARERWVPLATILAADEDSPYYNESKQAGSLYDEGWALVQFLVTSKEYGPGFGQVLDAIKAGTPSIAALESVYRRPLSSIERELRVHLEGGANLTLFTKLKLDAAKDKIASERANTYDVQLTLASLARPASRADSRTSLENLAREDPKRPEPWVRLAYLALDGGDIKKALENFAKAYALGDHSPGLLWDYGRYAEGEKPEDSLRLLGELLKLEPDNLDARIELAYVQAFAGKPRESLATIGTIKQIDAEHGQKLFFAMARAQLQLGQAAEARASALRLQSVALTKDFRDRAAEILSYLDAQEQQARARSGRGAAAPAKPTGNSLAEVQGRIVMMDCSGVPSVVVETSRGQKIYVLEPNRYAITGNLPPGQGMRCGPQDSPPAVSIRYEVLPADGRGDGAVRELHFQ